MENGNAARRVLTAIFFHSIVLALSAQDVYTGRITGTNSVPLPGATILIKESAVSVNAGDSGRFSINGKPGETLEISFIGYQSTKVKLAENRTLNIVLVALAINLDEVLVTGYSSQRIKEITGSVAVVRPKELLAVPAGQVETDVTGQGSWAYRNNVRRTGWG